VGGEFANSIDNAVTQGAGGFVTNLPGLVLAVGLAGFLYQRKIFLRV
jgi:hypothetical protein